MGGEAADYLLVLRPVPGPVPTTIRLRKLLKIALRLLGLRAVRVQELRHGDALQTRGDQDLTMAETR